jgi:hypothetical protein
MWGEGPSPTTFLVLLVGVQSRTDEDAFVARLSADLGTLHKSTYLGGNYEDVARALTIHPTTGDVYVAGWTQSDNFPNTSGGAQGSSSVTYY